MKNLNSLRITNFFLDSFVFSLFLFLGSTANAQFEMTELPNGMYQFNSFIPAQNLHFYLLGDGYYQTDNSHVHEFGDYALPAGAVVYHTNPYDTNDPEEFIFNEADVGSSNPTVANNPFINQVELRRSWNLVSHKDNYFVLMFENNQYDSPVSGCVEFHYHSKDIELNNVLDNYGNTWVSDRTDDASGYLGFNSKVKWNFSNLNPGEKRYVYIDIKCKRNPFSKVITQAVMRTDECDGLIYNNPTQAGQGIDPVFKLASVVSNYPHDPNCIVSNPQILSVHDIDQTIRYRVYFQNEGQDPAQNVRIDLDHFGPLENVTLIEASHPCELSWSNSPNSSNLNVGGEIQVSFRDIYLPGINGAGTGEGLSDFEIGVDSYNNTIGWVDFDVCYNLVDYTMANLRCATLDGAIFFDHQDGVPVESNVCRNGYTDISEICPRLSPPNQSFKGNGKRFDDRSDINNSNNFVISPNPASNMFRLTFNEKVQSGILEIYNSKGQLMKQSQIFDQSNKLVDIVNLQNGLYFIRVLINGISQTKSFVKI